MTGMTDILNGTERVYNNPSQEEVYIVYFNPDSDNGGSLVTETIPYSLIKEAYQKAEGNDDVFYYLLAEGREPDTFVDFDSPAFEYTIKDYQREKNFWWSDMETLNYLAEGGE